MKICVILAGGDPVSKETFEEYGPKDAYIIAADSGLMLAESLGLKPDLIIGDFDSAPKPENGNVRVYPVEKDDTDLMLAVKAGLDQDCDEFFIFGATGGRLDHTFAAIQSLAFLIQNEAWGTIISDDTHIDLLLPGQYEAPYMQGFSLSLFSWEEAVLDLEISGTKYNGKDLLLNNAFPLGVSNEVVKGFAKISFSHGALLVIRSRL